MSDKQHVSVVICGHVDAGKSTTTGHLIFKLGGISEREMEKLQKEADTLGKSSFAFAFYMDKQKDERERGVTIACTTKEFFTDNFHYTIIDAPGHRDFVKNMISGAAQADVAVLMVPADGNFISSIASGKTNGEVKGQTREHARLLNLLGVKQLIVCVNKMDSDLGQYKKERYEEIINEVRSILIKVGWKKGFIENRVPFIPISGYRGDNLIEKSTNMPWWTGVDVKVAPKKKVHVHTMLDALNDMVQMTPKDSTGPLRIPVSGVYKIKGVGDIITGRIEGGTLKPGQEVKFVPTDTTSSDCRGKAFSIEMHHKSVPEAVVGDNVGINVKNLNKSNMPKVGDVIVTKDDNSLKQAKSFVAQCQVLDHPGQLKAGYTPIAIAATGKAPIRITKINWKQSKKTGNVKVDDPEFIETNDLCELVFEPQGAFVVQEFKDGQCEILSRIAILEGYNAVLLGRVVSVTF